MNTDLASSMCLSTSQSHTQNLTIAVVDPPGSIPSLAMGLACGSLMGVGAYQTTNDPKNVTLSLGKSLLSHKESYICIIIYAVSVCLSVCLSLTHTHTLHMHTCALCPPLSLSLSLSLSHTHTHTHW